MVTLQTGLHLLLADVMDDTAAQAFLLYGCQSSGSVVFKLFGSRPCDGHRLHMYQLLKINFPFQAVSFFQRKQRQCTLFKKTRINLNFLTRLKSFWLHVILWRWPSEPLYVCISGLLFTGQSCILLLIWITDVRAQLAVLFDKQGDTVVNGQWGKLLTFADTFRLLDMFTRAHWSPFILKHHENKWTDVWQNKSVKHRSIVCKMV